MATATGLPVRLIKRSLLDTRWAARASLSRSITTIQHTLNTEPVPEPLLRSRAHPIPERDLPTTPKPPSQPSTRPRGKKPAHVPPPAIPRSAPTQPEYVHSEGELDESVRHLLPLLKAQGTHYLRAHIHGKPYLITPGDTIRLPFLMHGVLPGDILRLNRASLLGSRDYTLKPGTSSLLPPKSSSKEELDGRGLQELGYIDERLFTCRARVLGTELEPLRIKEKTKRRQRHIRRVRSKHAYTVLRVMEIGVADAEGISDVRSGIVEVGDVEGRSRVEDSRVVEQAIERDDESKIEELVEKTAKVSV